MTALRAALSGRYEMKANILLAMGKATVEQAHELLAASEQRMGVTKARVEPAGNALVAATGGGAAHGGGAARSGGTEERRVAEQRRMVNERGAAGIGPGGSCVVSSVTCRGT